MSRGWSPRKPLNERDDNVGTRAAYRQHEANRLYEICVDESGNLADSDTHTRTVLELARLSALLASNELQWLHLRYAREAQIEHQQAMDKAAAAITDRAKHEDMPDQLLAAFAEGTRELADLLGREPGIDVLTAAAGEIRRLRREAAGRARVEQP